MEEKGIKIKSSYNIDKKILLKFNGLAKEKSINKSQFIENYLKEWIIKNK